MSFKSSSMRLKYRNIIQIFTTFALLPPTYCSSWVRCWSTLLVSPLGWCGPLLTARVASKFWLKLAMQMMKFSRFDRLHILYIVKWILQEIVVCWVRVLCIFSKGWVGQATTVTRAVKAVRLAQALTFWYLCSISPLGQLSKFKHSNLFGTCPVGSIALGIYYLFELT